MKNDLKEFFSIGEIAKSINITRRIILNYEAKGLIAPDIKDGATGNRYYTIDTLTQIRTIRMFQDLGLSLDEIRDYLNDSSELDPVIKRLEAMCDKLNLTIEKLKERSGQSSDSIKAITIEPQTVYQRIYHTTSIADKASRLRETALEAIRKHGMDTTKRMYFTEHAAKAPEKVSYCVAIAAESEGEFVKHIPSLNAIALFHHGAYEEISQSRNKLIDYARQKKIKLSGIFRNLYLEGPPQHKDKSKFITQIIAIVEP